MHAKDGFTEGWSNAKCGNGESHLKEIGPTYKANLAKADLITIELGSNDLLSYLIFRLTTYVEEQAQGTSMESEISSLLEAMNGESEGGIFTGLIHEPADDGSRR